MQYIRDWFMFLALVVLFGHETKLLHCMHPSNAENPTWLEFKNSEPAVLPDPSGRGREEHPHKTKIYQWGDLLYQLTISKYLYKKMSYLLIQNCPSYIFSSCFMLLIFPTNLAILLRICSFFDLSCSACERAMYICIYWLSLLSYCCSYPTVDWLMPHMLGCWARSFLSLCFL